MQPDPEVKENAMYRHSIISTLIVIFIVLTSGIPASAQAQESGRPDIVVKISRLSQALDLIDKLAAADNSQPTASPSFFLRSLLFGTDWIDPNRPIVIAINYSDMPSGAQPVMAALVPYVRKNDDFHISYSAVSKMDHYLVPLPPKAGAVVPDQMAYQLAEASREKPTGFLSATIAASQLLTKADTQIQKMLLDLEGKMTAQKGTSGDISPEEVNNLLKNFIHIAKQLEFFSMGMDLSESELTIFSDALALKETALAKLFTRGRESRFSRMATYSPAGDIRFASASYDIQGMLDFFNTAFGEFYKAIGLDLASMEKVIAHFTGEMAGGLTLTDAGMAIEMIAVLKDASTNDPDFLESVYLPWMMDYGRQIAAVYSQQTPKTKITNIFSRTQESTVNGNKVHGIACEIPFAVPGRDPKTFSVRLRATQMGDLLIAAPDDKTLSELMTMAKTLEKQPTAGPLMRMDIDLGAYLKSVQSMIPDPEAKMPFNMENLGSLVYTFDLDKGKLSNQYILKTDDIRSIVAAFQQAGAASAAPGGPADQRGDATDYSFSQSAPTLLQDMGKPRKPAPRKEDTAAFWLDKGLLYATYGNDAEAIKFYKKALQIEPENSNALFNMGVSYSSMGKYDQAIDVLNQAIFLAPDNGDYLYGLGWAYLLKGESVKAMEYIGTAADLGNPDARKYLIKHPAPAK